MKTVQTGAATPGSRRRELAGWCRVISDDVEDEEERVFVPKFPGVLSNFRHLDRETRTAAAVDARTPPMATQHPPESSAHPERRR